MKGNKFASIGLTVLIAAFLWVVPVWASPDDPWAPDMGGNQLSSKTTIKVVPVLPAEEDRGYPWFHDIEKDNPTIMRPITVFGVHPRPVEEDTGYPWFADISEDNQTASQLESTTQ